ncbi:MAG: hypothetical protein K0S37_3662 [Microbacterium sp.]|jgi:hypothetical protein|nr:hypothetical protein [Microbacterium sp.]
MAVTTFWKRVRAQRQALRAAEFQERRLAAEESEIARQLLSELRAREQRHDWYRRMWEIAYPGVWALTIAFALWGGILIGQATGGAL